MTDDPPLTRKDLDFARCMVMNCTTPHPHALILHAMCHPHAALEASYFAGIVALRCSRCLMPIARIAVKDRP